MLGYLDFDLGEELAKDEHFTQFTHDEVALIGEAIRHGTPEEVRHKLKMDRIEPTLDALVRWLWSQRSGEVDSADLKAILDGNVDIDISSEEPHFQKRS
jgi:hypothetical protein